MGGRPTYSFKNISTCVKFVNVGEHEEQVNTSNELLIIRFHSMTMHGNTMVNMKSDAICSQSFLLIKKEVRKNLKTPT
jgi:hypothetical protein